MNKKLFMLAVAFVGAAGISYAGGEGDVPPVTPEAKPEAKTCPLKSGACAVKAFVLNVANGSLDAAALDNIPFVSCRCADGKSRVALKLAKAAAVVALVQKSGVVGWVRKNIVGRIPGCGVEVDEDAA